MTKLEYTLEGSSDQVYIADELQPKTCCGFMGSEEAHLLRLRFSVCHGFDGSGSGLRVFDSVLAQARSLNSEYPDYVLLRI